MSSATSKVNSSGPQFDEEKHVQGLQPGCLNGKEVAGQELLPIVAQERPPIAALLGPLGRRWHVLAFEYISNRRAPNLVA